MQRKVVNWWSESPPEVKRGGKKERSGGNFLLHTVLLFGAASFWLGINTQALRVKKTTNVKKGELLTLFNALDMSGKVEKRMITREPLQNVQEEDLYGELTGS